MTIGDRYRAAERRRLGILGHASEHADLVALAIAVTRESEYLRSLQARAKQGRPLTCGQLDAVQRIIDEASQMDS